MSARQCLSQVVYGRALENKKDGVFEPVCESVVLLTGARGRVPWSRVSTYVHVQPPPVPALYLFFFIVNGPSIFFFRSLLSGAIVLPDVAPRLSASDPIGVLATPRQAWA